MIQRVVLILLGLTLIPIQAGHSTLYLQGGQEVSDAQKIIRCLFAGQQDTAVRQLWTVASSRLMHRFPKQPYPVEEVAISPDGKTIAFESQDGTGINPFAPGIIKIWDVTTARELYRLAGHQSRVSALVFSSDGKWLASGSWDRTAKLWDVSKGKLIRSFPAEKEGAEK